jgi:hypothetical protein
MNPSVIDLVWMLFVMFGICACRILIGGRR